MSVSHTTEELSSTRRKFKITVKNETVKEAFTEAAEEVQKTADVRGFRKGKVPLPIVRKFFEGDIRKRAFNKVIDDSYREVTSKADFQLVSHPQIEADSEFEENKDLTYTATVDVNPPLTIKGYKELKLESSGKKVTDEDVNSSIENLRRAQGKLVPDTSGKAAAAKDYVTISFEAKADGKDFPGSTAKDIKVELGRNFLPPELDKGLEGMKAGDSKKITVKFADDNPNPELKGKTAEYNVTLSAIEHLELPALNDEFAKKFGVESLEKLTSSVKDGLSRNFENSELSNYREQIIKQLLEKNEFEVPESLLEATIQQMIERNNQQARSKEELEDPKNEEVQARYKEWGLNEVRAVLALGNIAREEKITVDNNELSEEVAMFAAENGMDPQTLIKRGGRQIIEELRGRALINKVVKHLVEINTKK